MKTEINIKIETEEKEELEKIQIKDECRTNKENINDQNKNATFGFKNNFIKKSREFSMPILFSLIVIFLIFYKFQSNIIKLSEGIRITLFIILILLWFYGFMFSPILYVQDNKKLNKYVLKSVLGLLFAFFSYLFIGILRQLNSVEPDKMLKVSIIFLAFTILELIFCFYWIYEIIKALKYIRENFQQKYSNYEKIINIVSLIVTIIAPIITFFGDVLGGKINH